MELTKKQKIQKERGEYTKKRFKKFSYLKNTGQYGNYLKQKINKKEIKKEKPIVVEEKKKKWWERLWI